MLGAGAHVRPIIIHLIDLVAKNFGARFAFPSRHPFIFLVAVFVDQFTKRKHFSPPEIESRWLNTSAHFVLFRAQRYIFNNRAHDYTSRT